MAKVYTDVAKGSGQDVRRHLADRHQYREQEIPCADLWKKVVVQGERGDTKSSTEAAP